MRRQTHQTFIMKEPCTSLQEQQNSQITNQWEFLKKKCLRNQLAQNMCLVKGLKGQFMNGLRHMMQKKHRLDISRRKKVNPSFSSWWMTESTFPPSNRDKSLKFLINFRKLKSVKAMLENIICLKAWFRKQFT